MNWLNICLGIVCAYLVFAPPRYDPAIRLKELLDSKRKDWKS